ncbi:MAG: ribonuclease domain-containing protein [Lautropia sp.]
MNRSALTSASTTGSRPPPARTARAQPAAWLWPLLLGVVLSLVPLLLPGSAAGVAQARDTAGSREQVAAIGHVDLADLPVQARRTLQLIRAGGPFPYAKDGTVFGNRERLLPRRARGYYTEYTVPTPGARNRGARRIVAGGDPARSGEYYYTDDHYASFRRIRTGDE